MMIKDLDKIGEAREIVGSVRDNLIFLENSEVDQMPPSVYVALEVALARVLSILDDILEDYEGK